MLLQGRIHHCENTTTVTSQATLAIQETHDSNDYVVKLIVIRTLSAFSGPTGSNCS